MAPGVVSANFVAAGAFLRVLLRYTIDYMNHLVGNKSLQLDGVLHVGDIPYDKGNEFTYAVYIFMVRLFTETASSVGIAFSMMSSRMQHVSRIWCAQEMKIMVCVLHLCN